MPTVAVRVTRSRKKLLEVPKVKAALSKAMDTEVKPHFVKEFDKVVANWKHNPEFKGMKKITADKITVSIFPSKFKDIWGYVTKGTRPHIIRAKNARTLAFKWGGKGSYSPKTRPGGKFGGPGTSSGPMIFPKRVKHPGSKAREFEKVIAQKNKKWFSSTMENIWRRVIRAAQ